MFFNHFRSYCSEIKYVHRVLIFELGIERLPISQVTVFPKIVVPPQYTRILNTQVVYTCKLPGIFVLERILSVLIVCQEVGDQHLCINWLALLDLYCAITYHRNIILIMMRIPTVPKHLVQQYFHSHQSCQYLLWIIHSTLERRYGCNFQEEN